MDFPLPIEEKDNEEYRNNCRWCGEELNDRRKRYCCKEHGELWVDNIYLVECFWHTRELALERDNHTCKGCEMTETEHRKIHKRGFSSIGLHVHHIKPREQGGSHRLENLVTLCIDCHKEVHKNVR